ncbi:MAG: LCP family protein [Candidatus Obscuribacterales bacterium]
MKRTQGPLFILQTALAIMLGVAIGVGILSVTHKNTAHATGINQDSTQSASAPAQPFGSMQIFPSLSERMTLLVLGVDSNGRNTERFTGTRSDTIILVSLDPFEKKVGLVSVPRDTHVPIAGSHGVDKINSAHSIGGPELTKQTLVEMFGVPIDHYICVDTQGLKGLCELIGPVEVLVEKEMHYVDHSAKLNVDLQPGLQTLTPAQVEQYIRFRHDATGDIGRMERQQWFLRQAARKLKDPQIVLKLPEMIKLSQEYVRTDLSPEDMLKIAVFGKDIEPSQVTTATLPGTPEMISGISYWTPDIDQSKAVFRRILGISGGGAFVDGTAPPEYTQVAVVDDGSDPGPSVKPQRRGPNAHKLSVALRYPRGCEHAAETIAQELEAKGYWVRYKWSAADTDCQHEEILMHSARADEYSCGTMRSKVPDLTGWPSVLALEARPACDFTLVITPRSTFLHAASAAEFIGPRKQEPSI